MSITRTDTPTDNNVTCWAPATPIPLSFPIQYQPVRVLNLTMSNKKQIISCINVNDCVNICPLDMKHQFYPFQIFLLFWGGGNGKVCLLFSAKIWLLLAHGILHCDEICLIFSSTLQLCSVTIKLALTKPIVHCGTIWQKNHIMSCVRFDKNQCGLTTSNPDKRGNIHTSLDKPQHLIK